MKSFRAVLFFTILVLVSGCSHYSDISGKVVDNATGKPIKGAVVVAQWTNTRGIPGMQYHNLHRIVETLTDKEGKFSISGTSGFIINPPEMIIYKEGYTPWRNDQIFPSCNIVKNHEWFSYMTYKLDVFTDKYTFEQLYSFLDAAIMGSGGPETPTFNDLHHKISVKRTQEIENKKTHE